MTFFVATIPEANWNTVIQNYIASGTLIRTGACDAGSIAVTAYTGKAYYRLLIAETKTGETFYGALL